MRAKDLNDVSLPIDSAVAQVCGIQRRFLVGIVGIIPMQIVEGFRRSICGNGLRQERVDPRLVLLE